MNKTSFIRAAGLVFLLVSVVFSRDAPSVRIISCAPNFTEILYALGLGEQVVGVTDFCRYPPAALEKERIGGFLNPNMEKIIRLDPSLVIIPKTKSLLQEKIKTLGLSILEVPNETLSDSLKAIEIIGEATGASDRAKKLKATLEGELEAIREKYKGAARTRALIVVDRSPDSLKDIYVSAPGTYLNEILEISGGRNVLSKQPALYPKISKESLIGLDPDVILDMTLAGQSFTTQTLQVARQSWEDLALLRAVKNKRVFMLTNPKVTIQGPRVAETARIIASLLHKENER